MRTWIVITTVNHPTDAIRSVARLAGERDWRVAVVGDASTPEGWACAGTHFLSLDEQHDRFGELARLIPLRHYCRKNLGYLYAIQEGADCILETDDDNLPYESFGRVLEREVSGRVVGGERWINVYAHYAATLIWPRGLPLDAIHAHGAISSSGRRMFCPVQQYLADSDPDVDAIWRLLFKQAVRFDGAPGTIILERGSYVPFNSQNTAFFREAFPLLYLPCHASFRMTDIWRSLVAQRVLWCDDAHLCFHPPTVEQVRNKHDLLRDFRDEVDGYLHNRKIGECLDSLSLERISDTATRAVACWNALERLGLLPAQETRILHAWLSAAANRGKAGRDGR